MNESRVSEQTVESAPGWSGVDGGWGRGGMVAGWSGGRRVVVGGQVWWWGGGSELGFVLWLLFIKTVSKLRRFAMRVELPMLLLLRVPSASLSHGPPNGVT